MLRRCLSSSLTLFHSFTPHTEVVPGALISKMAPARGRRCGALWVKLLLFFSFLLPNHTKVHCDRGTLLWLRERSDVGLSDPSSLESFPELAGYADSTLSRPLTGSPPGWGKDTRWGTNTYIAYRTVSLSCRRLFLFFSFLQICSQC